VVEEQEAKKVQREAPARVAQVSELAGQLHPSKAWDSDANRAAVNVSLSQYVCPSAGLSRAPDTPGLTTYVGFAGVGADAATLPLSDPRAGFFGYDRLLTEKELQALRGEANTAVAIETAFENGPWAAGGFPTVRGLPPDEPFCIGPGRAFGGIHRTGANVLFADASVRFFQNDYETAKLRDLVVLHE
jgi:prepilin-type processing-associated H-X9-DG protein